MEKILFLEKVFLKKKKSENLRGVELFNLSFIDDLLSQAIDVFVVAHSSWKPCFSERFTTNNFHTLYYSGKYPFLGAIRGVFGFKTRFTSIFLANTGDTLIGAMLISKIFKIAKKQVLLAHREPSKIFVKISKFVKLEAISVNRKIAMHFTLAGCRVSEVYYGIKNSAVFLNLEINKEHRKIVFAVVGDLDNKWKGADTAIKAFKELKEEVSNKCELKLASYSKDIPQNLPNNIKAYNWLPYEEMVNFYDSLDVLIVPSYDENVMRETFSQAMVQGMFSGLPILANDLDILKEKLDEGGGFIFKNIDELKEKIEELTNNASLRHYLGEKARKIAKERYVWDTKVFFERFLK